MHTIPRKMMLSSHFIFRLLSVGRSFFGWSQASRFPVSILYARLS